MDVVNLENLVTCVNLLDMDGSGESGSDRPGQLGESVRLATLAHQAILVNLVNLMIWVKRGDLVNLVYCVNLVNLAILPI